MKVKDYKNCCRLLSQLSRAVVSFDICCKLLPALAAVTNCCQLWQLVQDVASFASTWRLIPESTDQLYAIPIDCIASFLLSDFLQDCDTVAKYQWWPPPWIITLAPDLDKFRIAIKIRFLCSIPQVRLNETTVVAKLSSCQFMNWYCGTDETGKKCKVLLSECLLEIVRQEAAHEINKQHRETN